MKGGERMQTRATDSASASAAGERRTRRDLSRAARRRALGGGVALNITPMIDVVFLLMVYFVLVGQFRAPEEVFPLDLPRPERATAAAPPPPADPFALPERPIRVIVRSMGAGPEDCALATDWPGLDSPGGFTDLSAALTERFGGELSETQQFIIEPAGSALWEHTLAALNAVERAGFTRIRLADPDAAGRAP